MRRTFDDAAEDAAAVVVDGDDLDNKMFAADAADDDAASAFAFAVAAGDDMTMKMMMDRWQQHWQQKKNYMPQLNCCLMTNKLEIDTKKSH